jgi:hypothetical protein
METTHAEAINASVNETWTSPVGLTAGGLF